MKDAIVVQIAHANSGGNRTVYRRHVRTLHALQPRHMGRECSRLCAGALASTGRQPLGRISSIFFQGRSDVFGHQVSAEGLLNVRSISGKSSAC